MERLPDFVVQRMRRNALEKAESEGKVADSHSVRLEIMSRIKSGAITLAEGQAELKRIQQNAKKIGLVTRAQAYK